MKEEWNLLGLGNQDFADRCEREPGKYEGTFGIAEYRKDNPDVEPTEARFKNPVPVVGRYYNKPAERERERETRIKAKRWPRWQRELKDAF